MAKLKGLGRGLDALLSGGEASEVEDRLQDLPIHQLQPGKYQPRTRMDQEALRELADSIKARGLIQPILVREVTGGKYEIIAGERRWRAAGIAGLAVVPTLVREVPDEAALAMALIENIQRENLNPLEEANGIRRLIDEFEMTHQTAAEAVGRSRSAVTNMLRLTQLPQPVQELLMDGSLDMGHARALLALPVPEQAAVAREVAQKGLSVRETERLVQHRNNPRPVVKHKTDPDIQRLQDDLSAQLGAEVTIQTGSKGRGKLIIDYTSLDQLDGILNRFRP